MENFFFFFAPLLFLRVPWTLQPFMARLGVCVETGIIPAQCGAGNKQPGCLRWDGAGCMEVREASMQPFIGAEIFLFIFFPPLNKLGSSEGKNVNVQELLRGRNSGRNKDSFQGWESSLLHPLNADPGVIFPFFPAAPPWFSLSPICVPRNIPHPVWSWGIPPAPVPLAGGE